MRTIKRYSNRKLYDTEAKQYVTLEGIADLVREGIDVEVIDKETGEDLTAVTLSQIIFEQQKRAEQPTPLGFFTNLIRFDHTSPLDVLRRSVAMTTNTFAAIEKEIEHKLRELQDQGEMTGEQLRRARTELRAKLLAGESDSPKSNKEGKSEDEIAALHERIDQLNARLDKLMTWGEASEDEETVSM